MILGILASAIRAANAALSYDPYFDKVTALLHLDGADGSTTITDVTGRVWAAYSGAKLGTTNPKFGSAALELVGQVSGEANTTRLFTEAKNHTFGSRDFTVELFARQNRVDARAGVLACVDYEDSGSSSAWRAWSIAIDGNGRPYARISSDGTSYTRLLANLVVPVEGYYHYALVRKGSLIRLFVDGVQQAEATFTGSMFESPIGIAIGSWATAKSEAFVGQIDEFRITDGVARYWDDFKAPTKAFYNTGKPSLTDPYFDNVSLLLHAESPDGSGVIVDSSKNARTPSTIQEVAIQAATHKVGEGALRSLRGSGAVLNYPASVDFDFGRPFTLEFWMYVEEYVDTTSYFMANDATRYLTLSGNGSMGSANMGLDGIGVIPKFTWVHIALCRNEDGNVKTFRDGKKVGDAVYALASSGAKPLGLFNIPGRTDLYGFKGCIDEFRWTAGVARYAVDFTPSTTPFPDSGPPVAPPATDPLWDNVALLMHFDAADGSNTFTYFSKGAEINSSDGFNAVYQRAAQKKFGSTSLKADSSAGKLNFAPHASLALPMQFTIEFWMYPTAVDVTGYLVGASGSRNFTINGEGTLIFYGFGIGLVIGKPAKDAWTHVAVSRDAGGNLRGFLNGKLLASTTNSNEETSPQPLGIVNIPGNANAAAFSYGYIDEVRITTGATRYTAEFTPPTEAFPSTKPDTATDPYWANVKSLLRMDTSPTQDLASSKPAWQKFGAGALQSTVQLFKQPTMQMDGSTALESNIPFNALGREDYTAEVWFYPTKQGSSDAEYQRIISIQADRADVLIARIQNRNLQVVMYTTQQEGFFNGLAAPNWNAWNHLVVQVKTGAWQVFLNGNRIANGTRIGSDPGSAVIALGGARRGDGGNYDEYFTGYLSNFRATAGIARYNDGYTLPTDRFPKQAPVKHLYWRLQFDSLPSGGDYCINTLEFRDSVGGAQKAVGGDAQASDYFGAYYPAAAFDTDTGTGWVSTASTPWLGYQFGSAIAIAEYAIFCPNPSEAPTAWRLQWSEDGTTWTTQSTKTGVTWSGSNETKAFTV